MVPLLYLATGASAWILLAYLGQSTSLCVVSSLFAMWVVFRIRRAFFVPGLLIVGFQPGDPLMAEAIRKARETVPRCRELHEAGYECLVKFPFKTDSGAIEHLWGEVDAWRDDEVDVETMSYPMHHAGEPPGQVTVRLAEITDWSVEISPREIRGAFTNVANLRILERDTGRIPFRYRGYLRAHKDA